MFYKLAKYLSTESLYVPIIYKKDDEESGHIADSIEKVVFSLKTLLTNEFSYIQVAQYLFSTFGNTINARIITSDYKDHPDLYFVIIKSSIRPRLLMTDGSDLRLVKIADIICVYPFIKIRIDCFEGSFKNYAKNLIMAQLDGKYDFFDDKILTRNVQ